MKTAPTYASKIFPNEIAERLVIEFQSSYEKDRRHELFGEIVRVIFEYTRFFVAKTRFWQAAGFLDDEDCVHQFISDKLSYVLTNFDGNKINKQGKKIRFFSWLTNCLQNYMIDQVRKQRLLDSRTLSIDPQTTELIEVIMSDHDSPRRESIFRLRDTNQSDFC
jgi:hypothetical protein